SSRSKLNQVLSSICRLGSWIKPSSLLSTPFDGMLITTPLGRVTRVKAPRLTGGTVGRAPGAGIEGAATSGRGTLGRVGRRYRSGSSANRARAHFHQLDSSFTRSWV